MIHSWKVFRLEHDGQVEQPQTEPLCTPASASALDWDSDSDDEGLSLQTLKTSLEDLKGKVVYIDVWATWCGPCLREIPALKILETDYHDKNIAFVSLSIDEVKDYDKWRTMIIEKKLKGIQLMADNNWKSKFVTDYGIKGIPRFIIIDIDGRIVSSDAPRPSNSEIRVIFDELL